MTLGNAFIDSQAQIFALDVFGRNADFLAEIERGAALRRDRFAFSFRDGALHHLAVHVEADGFDVAVLLAARADSRRRAVPDRAPRCETQRPDR